MTKSNSDQPIQYQNGFVEFFKLKFKVTPDVLIPRPETELLVEEVLSFIENNNKSYIRDGINLVDIGTGAGPVAISIAKYLGLHLRGVKLNIVATDISQKALNVAKLNAKYHRVEDRIIFVHSNLLSYFNKRLYDSKNIPDIIVTNLPYIPTSRIPYLDASVKDYEPHIALDGGADGFELYRKLFQQIKERDWKPKLILGEIDYTHGELAVIEAQKYFPEASTEVKKDLAHLQRILTIIFPNLRGKPCLN